MGNNSEAAPFSNRIVNLSVSRAVLIFLIKRKTRMKSIGIILTIVTVFFSILLFYPAVPSDRSMGHNLQELEPLCN